MAKTRKDARGRALNKGEVQRSSDGRYLYNYIDPIGKRKYIYANDLATLRQKERELIRNQLDGLDCYTAEKASVNDTFDRYISTKYNLRDNTRSGYIYMYDRFVREDLGWRKLIDIKYSDILRFYYYLINEKNLALATLDSVHCILHPTFQLAVRDDIIRKNPTDGVMAEICKKTGRRRNIRHALTVEQQRAFMDYIANHPVYVHWWPLLTVLLGTGCRIGECLGLRWQDLDFDKGIITIDHTLTYYKSVESDRCIFHISEPKTEAGIRTIPMMEVVREAFQILQNIESEIGSNKQIIDGYSGFIFQNRFGEVPNPGSINRAIKRIIKSYNADESVNAKKENREALILPDFSCHHLRHTFATRLCEAESNLKVIQSVMGHKNIETTMDIYAEATERKKQESFVALSEKMDKLF
ncbi:Site-specific recombinase XerD [Lachnospiraceae bacterium]|nr:Site-specific recombinase XerD [Lachnospiraceae bacterium]